MNYRTALLGARGSDCSHFMAPQPEEISSWRLKRGDLLQIPAFSFIVLRQCNLIQSNSPGAIHWARRLRRSLTERGNAYFNTSKGSVIFCRQDRGNCALVRA